jgi:histidinol-phosphate/aromatic aminotransferase/cobyric acid decarboxylase-like protein
MRRFFDYYRQFEELPHEEISRELRERRDAERSLVGSPPLDLSGSGWHEPPHAEVVNAATFALRRAVNAYPDAEPLRTAIARSHDVDPARVAIGHGAGELLRAALRTYASEGDVLVAWPGWGPLPRLVTEAGATPVPATSDDIRAAAGREAPGAAATGDTRHPAAPGDTRHAAAPGETRHPATSSRAATSGAASSGRARGPRAIVVSRPGDPTGAVFGVEDLAGDHWLILDEALAGFLPDGEDALVDRPRVVHVRSFSKAHAMAGFRVGYAIVPEGVEAEPLEPVLGVGAAALAGALWAVEKGAPSAAARRAAADRERARLAAGPFRVAPGRGPYAWLETAGRPLAEELASRRIFVAPGSAWGDDAHVRVTLRDAAATDRLLEALEEIAATE